MAKICSFLAAATVLLFVASVSTASAASSSLQCGTAYKQCKAKCLQDEKESSFDPENAHRAANQCNVACIDRYCKAGKKTKKTGKAASSPESVVRSIYSDRPGDVRKHLSPDLVGVENSVSPSWMYGGYYPDSPRIKIRSLSSDAAKATVEADVMIDRSHVRRTLYLEHKGAAWIINRVRLDIPEGGAFLKGK